MGKMLCFGSDVDANQIIASQYLLYPSVEEMVSHCFESPDENFASAVREGDFVVACNNPGCGSSREQAPAVLKASGMHAMFTNSFARILFRSAIDVGLLVIVCEGLIDKVKPGEEPSLDTESGMVCVNGQSYRCAKLSPKMQAILDQGGFIAVLNREEV